MPFSDWMPKIKTLMEEVHDAALAAKEIPTAGAVYGYTEWPAALELFPSSLIGTVRGSQEYGLSSGAKAWHEIRIRMLFAGITLAEAQAMIHPLIPRVRDKFAANIQLTNTVDHILPYDPPADFYEGPGVMTYAGVEMPGIVFIYQVKEDESGTVTVSA